MRETSSEEMIGVGEIQKKKIRDLKKRLQQQKLEVQSCIEKEEALKRELKQMKEVLGLPHSEINGSMDICSFPLLIAAHHVLHRL